MLVEMLVRPFPPAVGDVLHELRVQPLSVPHEEGPSIGPTIEPIIGEIGLGVASAILLTLG